MTVLLFTNLITQKLISKQRQLTGTSEKAARITWDHYEKPRTSLLQAWNLKEMHKTTIKSWWSLKIKDFKDAIPGTAIK